jgi:uncharacterized membrane protein YfcA
MDADSGAAPARSRAAHAGETEKLMNSVDLIQGHLQSPSVVWTLLLLAAFATSALSGVLGMGGGLLLMAVMTAILPVAPAMMLHGAAQIVANGSRATLLAKHVAWRTLPPYVAGAVVAAGLFLFVHRAPPLFAVHLGLGAVALLAVLPRKGVGLDATRGVAALACGATVTGVQMTAGVAGPALDAFFAGSPLSRHQVVATKAATQVVAHALKLFAWGTLAGIAVANAPEAAPAALPAHAAPTASVSMLLAVGLASITGTLIGRRALDGWDDAKFRLWTRRLLLALGLYFLARGAAAFLPLP